jgi:hypothetical protein
MTPETRPAKPPFVENAELLLKLASAILGAFYVLGLLISNLQLMDLGVADFSSLQIRNIMTGFLFLFYVLLLLLSLAPVPIAIYAWWRISRWPRKKRWGQSCIVVLCPDGATSAG